MVRRSQGGDSGRTGRRRDQHDEPPAGSPPSAPAAPSHRSDGSSAELPHLTALRFFLALGVVFSHIEELKFQAQLPNHHDVPFFLGLGNRCVLGFFTLSGFLITWLLLGELHSSGTIAVGRFYARRSLRILPMYYLTVVMGVFVLPGLLSFPSADGQWETDYWAKLAMFLFLVPNLLAVLYGNLLYVGPLWSIGLEEQFYLFWPWLMRVGWKRPLALFGLTLGFWLVIRLASFHFPPGGDLRTSSTFVELLVGLGVSQDAAFVAQAVTRALRFEALIIGGLFAYALFYRWRVLTILFHPLTQVGAIAALALGVGYAHHFGTLHFAAYAGLFGVVIVNMAGNPKQYVRIDAAWTRYLGKLSYSLYLVHAAVIVGLLNLLPHVGIPHTSSIFSGALLVGTVGLSIIAAHCAYRWVERPFLVLKQRFSGAAAENGRPGSTPRPLRQPS